jgi:hypothetical protein
MSGRAARVGGGGTVGSAASLRISRAAALPIQKTTNATIRKLIISLMKPRREHCAPATPKDKPKSAEELGDQAPRHIVFHGSWLPSAPVPFYRTLMEDARKNFRGMTPTGYHARGSSMNWPGPTAPSSERFCTRDLALFGGEETGHDPHFARQHLVFLRAKRQHRRPRLAPLKRLIKNWPVRQRRALWANANAMQKLHAMLPLPKRSSLAQPKLALRTNA